MGRNSPYIHPSLVRQLKGLHDRLTAAPHMDKAGSWIGAKMTRPSFDKLGGWFEERISNFIAGGEDSHAQENTHQQDHSFSGPFAHYSHISSATSSTIPTPQRSTTDLTETTHAPTPPYRSGSAMALRPATSSHTPINRASSAMDYIRRKASPVPRVSSASAATASFADSAYANGYGHFPDSTPRAFHGLASERLPETAEEEPLSAVTTGPQVASWWGDANESGAPTPTAAGFAQSNPSMSESSDGFISLMDANAYSVTPTPSTTRQSSSSQGYAARDFDQDEDDLGLGNSSRRSKAVERSDSTSSTQTASTETTESEPVKAEEKPGKQYYPCEVFSLLMHCS